MNRMNLSFCALSFLKSIMKFEIFVTAIIFFLPSRARRPALTIRFAEHTVSPGRTKYTVHIQQQNRKMSSITPHNDNFLPENISIYNNNNNDDDDDDVNSNDDNDDANKSNNSDDDDEEFDDFISSQWKDSVEIGLIINYPLPCTNYLVSDNKVELTNNSDKKNEMSSDTSITENENDTNNNINNNSNDNHARLPSLILSTRLEERSIAPIFDGTQWAGTRVWKAAILAVEYLIRLKQTNKNMLGSSSLLELGCGLGVPGMIWKQLLLQEQKIMGSSDNNNGRVVLTDRDSLITQLETNIENNFHVNDNIIASPLDWSTDGIQKLLLQNNEINDNPLTFDICLNCDCIYEPLYGRQSWESLADVLIEIAKQSPTTLLVTSVERRNQDNLEGFLTKLKCSGVIGNIDCVITDNTDPHHIIEIYVTKGIE